MIQIIKKPAKLPADNSFKWRDRLGDFHRISSMNTGHLFNTFCMIWNHTMPEDARTHQYKRYSFDPFYSPEYMKKAIRAIFPELLKREDLTPDQLAKIHLMAEYFKVYSERYLSQKFSLTININ